MEHLHLGGRNTARLMTIEELAQLWAVSKATLYNWVYQKRIPYLKIGRSLRFDPVEIKAFLDRSRIGTAGKR